MALENNLDRLESNDTIVIAFRLHKETYKQLKSKCKEGESNSKLLRRVVDTFLTK